MNEVENQRVFSNELLRLHNKYRSAHGNAPLKINDQLSEDCIQRAKHNAYVARVERDYGDFGENTFHKKGSVSASEVAGSWYNEMKYYPFGRQPPKVAAENFSQMVWKDTKELGVGYEVNENGMYVVARYYPAGNIPGKYNDNVPPPRRISGIFLF